MRPVCPLGSTQFQHQPHSEQTNCILRYGLPQINSVFMENGAVYSVDSNWSKGSCITNSFNQTLVPTTRKNLMYSIIWYKKIAFSFSPSFTQFQIIFINTKYSNTFRFRQLFQLFRLTSFLSFFY